MNKCKRILALLLMTTLCVSMSACGKKNRSFKKLSKEQFIEATKKQNYVYEEYFTQDEADQTTSDILYGAGVTSGTNVFMYFVYKDNATAKEYFQSNYFEQYKKTKEMLDTGKSIDLKLDEDSGYVLIDLDQDEAKGYGGYFLKEDTIVVVATLECTDSNKSAVDALLGEIDYPKP